MNYYILRNRLTNKIENYYLSKQDVDALKENIELFNLENRDKVAELVEGQDLLSLIVISEKNKKLKESDLKEIENSIEGLRNDFFSLIEGLK